ncbi:MAG: aminotransferase class I/II-fold pyridoxal phosphate-dependent enzyme [bacterium]|nr:aminotransferase class I/II-fold pyridoxal phosphate-dependent enzyme [bacterium]
MKVKFCQESIFTSLSPNTEKDDIILALKLIFQPWKWKKVESVLILEKKFQEYLNIKYTFAFNSGRTAFLAILKCLNLEPGSDVLIQGFTCNAVVNPILAAGLKPVFIDIDENTLNINPIDLERKISSKSKIVIVQHTFGLPAEMNKISEICQRHNLILIEDCAHSLGALHANGVQGKLGTFGKASFFSFGRDKVISSVSGGMAVTNDEELGQKLKEYQQSLNYPSNLWIFRELLHPILTNFFVMPLYGFYGLGKWALIFLLRTGILSKSATDREKKGIMSLKCCKRMPEPLTTLALNQFKKLERFIDHQRQIAKLYDENLTEFGLALPPQTNGRIYLRYPLLLKNADTDKILDKARKEKIFLDDGWRKAVIVPPDTNQEKMGYRAGDCPIAEKVAKNILNLPTHINISEQKAQRIIKFLKIKLTEGGPLYG